MNNLLQKKHVLIITSLFYPEIGANSTRMTNLARRLVADGLKVTVVTAFPYYTSTIEKEFSKKMASHSNLEGIDIVRTWTFSAKKKNLFFRMLTFVSFMISSAIYCSFSTKKYDVILSISPPFFSLITAMIVSVVRRVPYIIDVQDLYPDTAIQLGKLKNLFLINLWRTIELMVYRHAAGIVVISHGFKREIEAKGIEADKIAVIESWVDTTRFDSEKIVSQKTALGLQDKFIVLFLGNIGYAQRPDYIVKAAKLLRNDNNIIFLFIGDGVKKSSLINECLTSKLENITFLPPQPHEAVPSFIKAADVCLVHLAKTELYKITIPSKTYEYMSMKKPIIMAVEGEAASLINRHKCGLVIEPENPELLKEAILTLVGDPEKRQKIGERARVAALLYSINQLTSKYRNIIETCIVSGR